MLKRRLKRNAENEFNATEALKFAKKPVACLARFLEDIEFAAENGHTQTTEFFHEVETICAEGMAYVKEELEKRGFTVEICNMPVQNDEHHYDKWTIKWGK